jgi:hypothetical protein
MLTVAGARCYHKLRLEQLKQAEQQAGLKASSTVQSSQQNAGRLGLIEILDIIYSSLREQPVEIPECTAYREMHLLFLPPSGLTPQIAYRYFRFTSLTSLKRLSQNLAHLTCMHTFRN